MNAYKWGSSKEVLSNIRSFTRDILLQDDQIYILL